MKEAFSLVPNYQVCIDFADGVNLSGRMYCGLEKRGIEFADIQQLIIAMDDIMNKISFPQSTVEKRAFGDRERLRMNLSRQELLEMRKFMADNEKGKQATFIVQVEYRHNAEWQGNVKWVEGESTHEFASTLDLIKFLDETGTKCRKENTQETETSEIERKKF